MRRLIYVPIIHTTADMGSRGQPLKEEFVRQFGPGLWAKSREVIDELWEGIGRKLLALSLPWDRVKIYQDGLPVSGKELEIAREVAAQGSKNYQLVLELVQRGATLMGTESPELLRREYSYIARIVDATTEAQGQEARRSYAAASAHLLAARDAFVARQVAETLQEGEIGVLFLGVLHQVDRLLPDDVKVEYLVDRLPLWVMRTGTNGY